MNGDLIRWTETFLVARTVEMIIEGNSTERHPVEVGVPQGSAVSPIIFAIYTSGLNKWVEQYVSEAEVLSCVDDLGWVATGSDVNHVVSILRRCTAKSIEWASRRGLQFDTAKMKAALFTCRLGHREHLWPTLTAKIRVGSRVIRFNSQVTRWLGVWIHTHLTLQEQQNRCRKEARGAEARLRTMTTTYGIVPESVRAVQVACVLAVALSGSELWWDRKEAGRWDDFQLHLNRQARSILGVLPTTPRGAIMRELGLTPLPVIVDSRQQLFVARLADACSCKLKELHRNPSSSAPICGVVKEEHDHG